MINLSSLFGRQKGQELFPLVCAYGQKWSGDVVVIGNDSSPTIDFYFRSRQDQVRQYSELNINKNTCESLPKVISKGCVVVLVRDTPLPVLKSLLSLNSDVAGIVWFIDDDIPGAGCDTALPQAYRKRLSSWYKKATPYLTRLCSKVWVSTPWLADKYNLPVSSVLAPVDPLFERRSLIRCFYHGTSSHVKDWEFVIEVASQVQRRNNNVVFEFIGDHALYKKCKGVPGIQILHPMKWPDYLSMTANRTMDIGLAPLLDTPFNKTRSHTKFLDICRQNAVGIYSSSFPFSSEIKKRNAGLVLPDTPESWVAGIEQLAVADRNRMCVNAAKLKNELIEHSGSLGSIL